MRKYKQMADKFEITRRHVNLTWSHHYEAASVKQIETAKKPTLSGAF